MLNYELARVRGLSPDDIKDLEALHIAMGALVFAWDMADFTGAEPRKKRWRKMVRRLEYQMQDKWKFPRDKEKHTHYRRFEGLYK
jgi:hypothetical protein